MASSPRLSSSTGGWSLLLRHSYSKYEMLTKPQQTVVLASAAAFAFLATAWAMRSGANLLSFTFRGRSGSDDGELEFADHREATFSLFRRDVQERLSSIRSRLEHARCTTLGTPQRSSLPCPAEPPLLPATTSLGSNTTADVATTDVVAVTLGSDAKVVVPREVAKTLIELDELLTKLLVDIDGAPVAGLDHLKVERKGMLQAVLSCSEEVTELRAHTTHSA